MSEQTKTIKVYLDIKFDGKYCSRTCQWLRPKTITCLLFFGNTPHRYLILEVDQVTGIGEFKRCSSCLGYSKKYKKPNKSKTINRIKALL